MFLLFSICILALIRQAFASDVLDLYFVVTGFGDASVVLLVLPAFCGKESFRPATGFLDLGGLSFASISPMLFRTPVDGLGSGSIDRPATSVGDLVKVFEAAEAVDALRDCTGVLIPNISSVGGTRRYFKIVNRDFIVCISCK